MVIVVSWNRVDKEREIPGHHHSIALLGSVGVPGDVVDDGNVTDLEVDALAGGLGRSQDLDGPLSELLLKGEVGRTEDQDPLDQPA